MVAVAPQAQEGTEMAILDAQGKRLSERELREQEMSRLRARQFAPFALAALLRGAARRARRRQALAKRAA